MNRKETIMYLTQEEFIILKCTQNGIDKQDMNKFLSKKICFNDPRIDALCQKYDAEHRGELLEKADIKKVEIRSRKNMPYFEYDDNMQLVKRIPMRKRDVNKLVKFFENVEDEYKEFKITYSQNGCYFMRYMKIDDKYIFNEVDGTDYSEEEAL